jgi:hypothetical protein
MGLSTAVVLHKGRRRFSFWGWNSGGEADPQYLRGAGKIFGSPQIEFSYT